MPEDRPLAASSLRGRPVAVVAVHGVGAHDAGASAHAIADLLLNLDADKKTAAYGAFVETALRIRTRRVEPCAPPSPPRPRRFFDERSRLLRDGLEGLGPNVPPDIVNMQGQLDEFGGDGPDDQYETIRLEGERLASPSTPGCPVHVYEMYWSDLVRVGNDFAAIFGELYQILFHLPSLGGHAVDFGTLQRRKSALWRLYSETQALAARLLTVGVPIFNLFLVVVATSFFPARLAHVADRQWLFGASVARWCAASLAAVAVAILGGLFAFRHTARATAIASASFAVAVAVGIATSYLHPFPILFVEWLILSGFAISIPIRAYDRFRPGANVTAIVIAAGLSLFVAVDLVRSPIVAPRDVVVHCLHAVEALFVGLIAVWLAYLPLQLAAAMVGGVAWLNEKSAAGRRDVGRIARTARLSLALPTALFLSFTIPAASATFRALTALLPAQPSTYEPTLLARFFDHTPVAIGDFADELVYLAGTDGLVVVVGVVAFSALFAGVGLLPAVLAEIFQPAGGAVVSKRYGRWMSSALGWMRLPAELLVLAAACATLFGVARIVASERSDMVRKAITLLACIVSGSTVGLVALRGRFESLSLGFRPALEAALDIDTYLREHPRDSTPRARIFARYISLLRYLRAWRDPTTGEGYGSIVLVAHSQGTVITADLLRFLERFPDSSFGSASTARADGVTTTFVSMGSPLRQLYAARLPDLYGWVGEELPHTAAIPDDAQPRPSDLGVVKWINAYRSGDYVGRALWRSQATDDAWACDDRDDWLVGRAPEGVVESADGTRREFCVGAGAHTHYWDDAGALIAIEIDRAVTTPRYSPSAASSPPASTPASAAASSLASTPASIAASSLASTPASIAASGAPASTGSVPVT